VSGNALLMTALGSLQTTQNHRTQAVRTAGLVGLVARGALYLALAVLSLELVFGNRGEDADPRGAMHDLAHNGLGVVVLVVLVIGFAAFALLHLYRAIKDPDNKTTRRVNDAFWAVVNALLAFLAASFLFSPSKPSGDTDQTDKTFTAKVMDVSGGRLLVGIVGLAIAGYGLYLLVRAFQDDRQDERAVLEAAPQETPGVRTLARVGNVARGAILGFIGVLVLIAGVQHDPNETEGLDGALKRLLAHGFGEIAVFLIALGFAAFGVYSIARAWVNRPEGGVSNLSR
jgi:Mn2+/Fe2+ NRAMP family transporter